MTGGTTIYESRARAKRRRRRGLIAAALVLIFIVVVAVAASVVVLRGGDSQADSRQASGARPPSPSSSPAVSVAGLSDLRVHRGGTVTIDCRIVGSGTGAWKATLIVRDAEDRQVKARLLDAEVASGRRVNAEIPIDLPPGRYTYCVLLSTGEDVPASSDVASASPRAMAPGEDAQGCAVLRVLAPLPPGYPSAKAVTEAAEWAGERDGDVSFAVVDSNGEVAGGLAEHRTFQAASLAKAILLVASLRADPTPDASTRATLTKMIEESDNDCAYTILGRVGTKGMRAVAKAAGMKDYEQGDGWLDTRISAADEARFFFDLESLVPAAGRGLARELLSGITSMQRWGIPAAAGPEGWKAYFKSGWLGLDNKLMAQAAWLEKGKRRWALAVLTDDNPSRSYGWDTQKGVAGLLLGQEPTPAYLARVLE